MQTSIVTTIVTSFIEAIQTAQNSGTALVTFCRAAAKAKFPSKPEESDVVSIVDAIAAKAGWNGSAREKVSKSEARGLIRAHASLPELMDALRSSEYGRCGYHDAVKLSRIHNKLEGSVAESIAAFNTKAETKAVDPIKKLEAGLKAALKNLQDGKRKDKASLIDQIKACATAFKIELV